MTLKSLTANIFVMNNLHSKKQVETKIASTKKTVSWSLGIIGAIIILSQGIPLLISYVKGEFHQYVQNSIHNPFPDSYKQMIEDEFAYYDPGKTYFENLSKNASNMQYGDVFTYDPITKRSKEIIVNREYNKNMYITIKSVDIKGIRITPNVESSERKVYDRYLKHGLAHFKGTPLPGDGGNSFIYGHSAVLSFFKKHSNLPETIFTKLEEVDIGDTVTIKKEEDLFEYVVRNKKIVDPEDFSILQTQGSKETVTLMTCWPLGAGIKRLVVVAERL